MPGVQRLAGAADQRRPADDVGVEPLGRADVERQHVEPGGLDEEQPLQLGELLGVLGGEVVGLRPVLVDVVQLPHVVVEAVASSRPTGPCAWRPRSSRGGRSPGCRPSRSTAWCAARRRRRRRSSTAMLDALHRALGDAVDGVRLGDPGGLEDGRADVDAVGELVAHLALGRDAVAASARSCRCGCRPSARRPAWSTGTACPSRGPSRWRSGCTSSACRCRRCARPGSPRSPARSCG